MKDIIVLLPGITGSVLSKDKQVVWGYSAKTIGKALITLGGTLVKALAMPHDDPEKDDLGDGIVAEDLMPDLHLLPGLWKIDGYGHVVDALTRTPGITAGRNLFSFPYDWRRDNRVAARKLARATHQWLNAWKSSGGPSDARVILLAHSMGGLVSRYFIECLEGWKVTRALITFGTPHRGSVNALDSLSNGMRMGPFDLSVLARQLTALYQLLPIYECYDPGNGTLVRVGETTGIANVDPQRATAALKFHREIEDAVTANRKLPGFEPYAIHSVVGLAQQTNLSARAKAGGVELLTTYEGQELGGDGTVPRMSAIPIELSKDARDSMYAGTKHGSLQNAAAVLQHVSGVLSGQAFDLGDFRKLERAALQVADVVSETQTIVVRARADVRDVVTATLWRTQDGGRVDALAMTQGADGWLEARFVPQPAGAYRVMVTSPDLEPAEDAFAVTEAP